MHRRDLSDAGWAILAPHLPPPPRRRGGRWEDRRPVLGGISHRPRTGVPWRVPGRYGPWQAVYDRFNALRASGGLGELRSAPQFRLNAAGLIDRPLDRPDGTDVRASRAAAGARGDETAPRRAG